MSKKYEIQANVCSSYTARDGQSHFKRRVLADVDRDTTLGEIIESDSEDISDPENKKCLVFTRKDKHLEDKVIYHEDRYIEIRIAEKDN